MENRFKQVTDAPEDLGDRRLRFICSTGDVDRDNDVIDQSGWSLSAYRSNSVLLWAHDHSVLPIGKAVSIGVEGGKLVAVFEFAKHQMAQEVFELYRGGFMRAVSAGFQPIEFVRNEARGGFDFVKQELLEVSAVPVPAQPRALIAAGEAGISVKEIRRWRKTLDALPAEDEPVLDLVDAPEHDGADAEALLLADDARLTDPPAEELIEVDEYDLAHAIAESVSEGCRLVARPMTQAAIDQIRGRLPDYLPDEAHRVRRAEIRARRRY